MESEMDSTESCTPANSNSSGTSDEGSDEAQPLNLSLTTSTKQGYDHDFIMNSSSHKTGRCIIYQSRLYLQSSIYVLTPL